MTYKRKINNQYYWYKSRRDKSTGKVRSIYVGPVDGATPPKTKKAYTTKSSSQKNQQKDINTTSTKKKSSINSDGGSHPNKNERKNEGDGMNEKLKIICKNGQVIDITISGTTDDEKIIVEPFQIQDRKVYGEGVIQHWKSKNLEEGLYFRRGDVYMQCANEMPKIKKVISELPKTKYYASKRGETIDSDGYEITTTKWKFDKIPQTEKGTVIFEHQLGDFLDRKGINHIEMDKAMKLWAEENEEAYLKREKEGLKRAQAVFDDDEADQGYDQACENAGISRNIEKY